jgi:hypothetical protein
LALTLTLTFGSTLQAAAPAGGHSDTLAARTVALAALAKRYRQAQGIEKQDILKQLTELARQRSELFSRRMRGGRPGDALKAALPEKIRNELPGTVQALVERRAVREGTLEVRYEEFKEDIRLIYELIGAEGRFPLHFAAHPPKLETGSRVRVSGVELQGEMAVESGERGVTILALDGSGSTQATSSGTSLSNTMGEQRTLVFLVNFQNRPEEYYTLEDAYNLVFGTVSDYYRENSSDQTWLSGDVVGWYTLPFDQPTDSATCKTSVISQYAQQAASDAGVDLSAYERYVYVFPQTSCFPSGSGTVGGNPSEAWINGSWFKLKTLGHELGHNLGLFHSHSLECGDGTLGTACQTFEYGDILDIMGNSSVGHFNAFQKERLGWLDPAQGNIATTEGSASYTLDTYETAPGSMPKALKVLKKADPLTGAKTWYYVEKREATGFDNFLAGYQNVLNGLVLRMADDSDPRSSVLLDMTPGSSTTWDWGDPALEFGKSFEDPESGLVLTSRRNAEGMPVVDVLFGQSTCSHTDPLVTVSPAEVQWSAPGIAVTYTVTITNGDNTVCAGSTFDLSANLPSGWSAAFGAGSLYVEAQASATTSLEVTSSPTAADGFYTFDITGRNSADPAFSGTTSATCALSRSLENQPPVAADDSASTAQNTPVVINVLANDADPDGDPVSVVSATQGSGGEVAILSDGSISYSPGRKFKGEDTFSYSVSDGALATTARVKVLVEGSESGAKGGGGGNGKGKPAQ